MKRVSLAHSGMPASKAASKAGPRHQSTNLLPPFVKGGWGEFGNPPRAAIRKSPLTPLFQRGELTEGRANTLCSPTNLLPPFVKGGWGGFGNLPGAAIRKSPLTPLFQRGGLTEGRANTLCSPTDLLPPFVKGGWGGFGNLPRAAARKSPLTPLFQRGEELTRNGCAAAPERPHPPFFSPTISVFSEIYANRRLPCKTRSIRWNSCSTAVAPCA